MLARPRRFYAPISVVSLFRFPFQDFKKNVKGVNGGSDFDQDMLNDIFEAIR